MQFLFQLLIKATGVLPCHVDGFSEFLHKLWKSYSCVGETIGEGYVKILKYVPDK